MVISDFAIKRPMITTVTMVALVVFGLFALWRLQTDEFPDIQQPVVLTFIPYPGASPEGVERELLKPVEDAIKGISGVDKIYGTAGDGYAQIITLFLFEKDPQVATQDIRDAISGIRSDLPVEMKEPVLQRFDPSDQPIVSMTLASPALTPAQLTRLADPEITSKLRGIPGIAQVQLVGGVKREMTIQLRPLPPGVKITIVKDAGIRVQDSVRNVEDALLIGALLTVLVVFVFLNSWRSTVITGLALPVSVLASFIAVWAFGFTLNTMSLLGLSLAIGILIDDAIVVRENIVRHIEMGKDHMTASHEGTDEIGLAVAATTFSIVAVFVPVAFMYGVAGQWFKPFALTIASSVLVSLFVSFSLDPMLSAYWADPQVEAHERRNPIARTLDRFNKWFNRMAIKYKSLIAWALDHRVAMVLIAIGSFIGALALPAVGLVGASFFGTEDQSEVNIAVETPPGSNLAYTRIKAEEAAQIARSHKEVRFTYTTLGGQTGDVNVGNIYVRMVAKSDRRIGAEDFGRVLRQEVGHIGGATMSVFTNDFQGAQKQIQIELRGGTAQQLAATAEAIADQVKQVKGAADVGLSTKGQKPEPNGELNRGLAGPLGVTVGEVGQALRPAFAGIKAGDWVDPTDDMRDVTLPLAPDARQRAAGLEQLPLVVTGADGQPRTLPLGQIATITQGLGPAQITHLDADLVVTVQANTSNRPLTEVMRDINTRIAKIPFPAGVHMTQGGETESQNEVFGRIFSALGIAVMLMYLILVMQFGSFLEPLAIMISLPLSLIGVMLALMFTHTTINIMSLIGVILLMGIVAKNAILLIDFAKWAREKEGVPRREALIQAGAIRLRPILMTTLALIAGMIPVALGIGEGAEFRAPLGRAVIGGVITSTLLTLVVIPTFYEILDEWREWVFSKFGVYKRRTAEHPIPTAARAATSGERVGMGAGVEKLA